MDDLISRQALMKEFSDFVRASNSSDFAQTPTWNDAVSLVGSIPSAQQWHVIKKRPMTNDERIEWSETVGYDVEDEDAFIYWNLPDDGEEVFVSSQYGYVYVDTFRRDEGCYFEESGDMDGIVAWMPLPEPYKGE